MSVTGGEKPTWEPALLLPSGLYPAGAQHPLQAGLASAQSRQSWACLSCSFQGCSAIPNCHKNKCFLLHITEQRNFPQLVFFALLFFFFSFLRPPSKSSLPPSSAASIPCKQAHGTHSLTHHTHGNTLMAPQRQALPGAGMGLAAHAAVGGGRAGRRKDACHQKELSAGHVQARRRVSARRLHPPGLRSASRWIRCGGWCGFSPRASCPSDTAALCWLPEQ